MSLCVITTTEKRVVVPDTTDKTPIVQYGTLLPAGASSPSHPTLRASPPTTNHNTLRQRPLAYTKTVRALVFVVFNIMRDP